MPSHTRRNPAGRGRTSYLALHWATQIAHRMLDTETYFDRDDSEVLGLAFATANAALEDTGLRVPGSNRLTAAGAVREAELLTRYTPEEIEAEYKALTASIE